MRRALTLMLVLAVIPGCLFGQDTKKEGRLLTFTSPDPSAPVPGETLRKLPIQMALSCKVNGQPKPFVGTGFIVGIDVPPAKEHRSFQYLVTNRHVAECWDDANHPQEVLSIGMRVNSKNGAAVTLLLNANGNAKWYFPDDESVDLAVTTVFLPNTMDHLAVPFAEIATRDSLRQHRIGEGSTIVVTGYFVQFPGERKFQPILRQGILSMLVVARKARLSAFLF